VSLGCMSVLCVLVVQLHAQVTGGMKKVI